MDRQATPSDCHALGWAIFTPDKFATSRKVARQDSTGSACKIFPIIDV